MKKRNYLALIACAISLAFNASASSQDHQSNAHAENEHNNLAIEFIKPKSFTDIRAGNEPRGKFRKRVLSTFESYFAEFSEKLPQGQKLAVTVTDIDLAGDTRSPRIPISSFLSEVRVMEDIHWPRMKFTYTLTDAEGNVLQTDDVDLRDLSYLTRSGLVRGSRQAFRYEYTMLERWFKDTF